MKGVILAGGTGSRLRPLTAVTNKHLLPVYDKPMIHYPIATLVKAGVTDIMVVTGGENVGDFLRLVGSGKDLGARVTYGCQDGSGGIPVALNVARDFVDGKCVVVLGDNITDIDISEQVKSFASSADGAHVFLKRVKDPQRFGIAELSDGRIASVVEKPASPKSDLAIIGIYMFDKDVFKILPTLKPSARGELEITDVIRSYMGDGRLSHSIVDGFWIDAGTFDSLFEANRAMAERAKRAACSDPHAGKTTDMLDYSAQFQRQAPPRRVPGFA